MTKELERKSHILGKRDLMGSAIGCQPFTELQAISPTLMENLGGILSPHGIAAPLGLKFTLYSAEPPLCSCDNRVSPP